jgi:hypothetical protein
VLQERMQSVGEKLWRLGMWVFGMTHFEGVFGGLHCIDSGREESYETRVEIMMAWRYLCVGY